MSWVLKDYQDRYLVQWIEGFGPAINADLTKAIRFDTKMDAMHHPAFVFPMTMLTPVEEGPFHSYAPHAHVCSKCGKEYEAGTACSEKASEGEPK